jgi:glycosyltransferase involved in cell wall biosynthesis
MKKILLVSNKVMHYRVSIYNYLKSEFDKKGYEFIVLSDELQKENEIPLKFEMFEMPLRFLSCKSIIQNMNPEAVIVFLHIKDLITWKLIHWLKYNKIPVAFWTKGGNWDEINSKVRYYMFNYIFNLSDGLILYSKKGLDLIAQKNRYKAFVASNTINFNDFPQVLESREQIKRELSIPFRKVVLFVGRMDVDSGRKKVGHLIEIFRHFKRDDVGLVLVGSGLCETLKAQMNQANTLYLGEVYDSHNLQISRIFKMADICSIPGHVGLGLNQAFFWGLPMVTEQGHQPPEIEYLKDGRNGFLVPENDLQALRERIIYLIDNDKVRAEFSRNAKDDILREASIEDMFSKFNDCIEFIINKRN